MRVAEINQFGSAQPVGSGPGPGCAQCEAMLADAIDGTLSATDQATFDRHIATCDVCSEMLADAQRGAALLSMLKEHRPEPSAALLERILAQTSGTAGAPEAHAAAILPGSAIALDTAPVAGVGNLLPFPGNVIAFPARPARRFNFNLRAIGQTMLQPRLAMTAAMAFFSIALTLNLTGVHLNQLKASDLKPSNLERNFSDANARAVRYYENLRVVYELESRVRDLQRANDNDSPTAPSSAPNGGSQPEQQKPKQERPKPNSGTSQRQPFIRPEIKLAAAPACSIDTTADRPLPASIVCSERFMQVNEFKEHVVEGGLV
ncbi:MAG TPA: zf-HC2 domain-containing protein [Granulicella sp.]|nr:zf-HC2 domain-containing protein [Granulicella sp.]